MRNSSIVIGIILSIIAFFVGNYSYGHFIEYSLPVVGDTRYLDNSLTHQFQGSLIFGFACALIPLSSVLLWKIARIATSKKRIGAVFVIVASACLAWFIRYQTIRSLAGKMSREWVEQNASLEERLSLIPLAEVKIERWVIAGVIVGVGIAFFVFRTRKDNTPPI